MSECQQKATRRCKGQPSCQEGSALHLAGYNRRSLLQAPQQRSDYTAEFYAQQLQRLQDVLLEKRPALVNRKGAILLCDNA